MKQKQYNIHIQTASTYFILVYIIYRYTHVNALQSFSLSLTWAEFFRGKVLQPEALGPAGIRLTLLDEVSNARARLDIWDGVLVDWQQLRCLLHKKKKLRIELAGKCYGKLALVDVRLDDFI